MTLETSFSQQNFKILPPSVLPEFIPLSNSDHEDNKQREQDLRRNQVSIPPPPARSPSSNFRNPDRLSSERHSNENGSNRDRSRESYRSNKSYSQNHHSRNRSSRSRSPHQREDYRRRSIERRRDVSPERLARESRSSIERRHPRITPPERHLESRLSLERRQRREGSSVFDRMSSPPVQRRSQRHSDESAYSQSNNTQFVRTISYDTLADNRFSPARYINEPPLAINENHELREFRERLIAAERHCLGLEATVKSYEREIHKLRAIVNTLIEDFEVVMR